MKLKDKINKLKDKDYQEYYDRFDYNPITNISFSWKYYIFFLLINILIILCAIYQKLDGIDKIELIKAVLSINQIITILLYLDIILNLWNIIKFYYDRHKFFKSRGF